MPRARKQEIESLSFEVTVWDTMEGDIVLKRWDATQSEVDQIEEQYRDEPFREVQVEER